MLVDARRIISLMVEPDKLSPADASRVVEMAWEDRTPFEAIAASYGLSEADVIRLMRRELSASAFKRWRARVSGRKTKHTQKRPAGVNRHQSSTHNKVNR
ncbi:MAG: TIGR03643 family protein [Pseudomonadota bacterium]